MRRATRLRAADVTTGMTAEGSVMVFPRPFLASLGRTLVFFAFFFFVTPVGLVMPLFPVFPGLGPPILARAGDATGLPLAVNCVFFGLPEFFLDSTAANTSAGVMIFAAWLAFFVLFLAFFLRRICSILDGLSGAGVPAGRGIVARELAVGSFGWI